MSSRGARAAVVVLVGLVSLGSATAASASNWTTPLAGTSHGQARSSTSPATPASVTAACTSSSKKTINVTWSAVTHATYNVYQSTTSATAGYSLAASGVATTSWTSPSLTNGSFWYEVAAVVGTNWTSALSGGTAGLTIRSTSPTCS